MNSLYTGMASQRRINASQNCYNKIYLRVLKDGRKEYENDGSPLLINCIYLLDREDVGTWWGLAFDVGEGDPDSPFTGGEYLFKLIAQEDYPRSPPLFKYLTPNGVYDDNKRPCISVGEYHRDNYNQTLKMMGFGIVAIEGLRGYNMLNGGINLLTTTKEEKLEYARKSSKWNTDHYPDIMGQFREHIDKYQLHELLPKLSLSNVVDK